MPYYASCLERKFLVVPYTKTYNDSRYLMSPGFSSPRDFLDTLTSGLDELLRERTASFMTVAVHARWSGQQIEIQCVNREVRVGGRVRHH